MTNLLSGRSLGAAVIAAALLSAAPVRAQQNFPTPNGAVAAITAIATGTTGAVTATLAATSNKTTYICGFDVSAAGGSATVSPITVNGLLGGGFTYQGVSSGGAPFQHAFSPCIAASGANTSITISTTADGTATAVDVQAWGFQQ